MLLRASVPVAFILLCVLGCGSRSGLKGGHEEILTECRSPEDCNQSDLCAPQLCVEGFCAYAEPVDCGEPPECASVACNSLTGQCDVTPLTQDNDRDGFFGPLPEFAPGQAGACGDDCNDNNASAFPGGDEICDGVDNDCDGIVDNGELYLTPELTEDLEPVVLASQFTNTSVRGADYGNGAFFTSFLGSQDDRNLDFIQAVDEAGQTLFPSTRMSQTRGPSFGGDVAWSGQAFGALWSDPDDAQYDVYFSLFDSFGNKLIPDVRVSDAREYSLRPRILFDQGRFIATWSDWRDGPSAVYVQLISADGRLIGRERSVTALEEGAEFPYIASTEQRFGLAYMGQEQELKFRTFDKEFAESTEPVVVARGANRPRVHALGDRFVVTWHDTTDLPSTVEQGVAVRGAVLDEFGTVLTGPTRLSPEVPRTRAFIQEVVSLGDRFLILYLANFGDERAYQVYAQVMDRDLGLLENPVALTRSGAGSNGLEAALSDQGRVGVFFNGYTVEGQSVNFLALGCASRDDEPPIR